MPQKQIMQNDKIRENFTRQRRNLLLISLVVLFAEMSEIEIHKISILGNEVLFKNPESILIILWVALIYWLVRYYQYFRDIGEKGFGTSFYVRLSAFAKKIAFKEVRKKYKKNNSFSAPGSDAVFEIFPREYRIYETSLRRIRGDVEFVVSSNKGRSGTIGKDSVIVEFPKLIMPIALSVFHVIFHTRLVSEYILPFCVSFSPIIYRFVIKNNMFT